MKLLKFFELYELQWSRLLHFRSGREATAGLEKKNCIVTEGGQLWVAIQRARAVIRCSYAPR